MNVSARAIRAAKPGTTVPATSRPLHAGVLRGQLRETSRTWLARPECEMPLSENSRMPVQFEGEAPRDWWQSAKRGFWGRCPHCNEGQLFRAYLKPVDACENCGEEYHHHRADDAPPYLTILFVGHLVGAMMLWMHERDLNWSIWTEAIVWPLIGLVLCLWFLPRFKGALIAYQWALRMHGFATATPARPASVKAQAPEPATT